MNKSMRLKFSDPAPDETLEDVSGAPVRISALWSRGTLLLAFTRHFGCPQCKEMLDLLSDFRDRLASAGIQIVVVTQGSPEEMHDFCARYAPRLTCLVDPERRAYRAYGLGRISLVRILLSMRVWRENERVRKRKGWKAQRPPRGQDALQMSGIFIIGQDGIIRLPYYYDHIADHPPFEILLHGFAGMDWKRPMDGPIVGKEESDYA